MFNENYNNFLLYLDPVPEIERSQLSLALLFEKVLIKGWVLWINFGCSSFETRVFPALVSLFILSDKFFLTLDLFLNATPKGWKESIGFPDPELHPESFEKISLKKSNILEASQILKIIG